MWLRTGRDGGEDKYWPILPNALPQTKLTIANIAKKSENHGQSSLIKDNTGRITRAFSPEMPKFAV